MAFYPRALLVVGLLFSMGAGASCTILQKKDDPVAARNTAVEKTREGLLLLQTRGDAAGAEEKFRQAVEADPNYADARANLGYLLEAKGQTREAIEHLRAAVAADPNNAAARNNLGVAYDRAGSPGLAVNEFKRALALDPRLRGVKLNLAVAYGNLGRDDLAITTFLEILRDDPKNVHAYAGLGVVYVRAGRFESASQIYNDGLKVAPNEPSLQAGLGVLRDAAGDPTAAVEAYSRAIKLAPNEPNYLAARGALALKLGDYHDAAKYYSAMSNIEWAKRNRRQKFDVKGLADAFFTLGDIKSNLGQYGASAREYARAITLDPALAKRAKVTDPDAHFALGVVYQEAGHLPHAKAEYETVLRLRPDYWSAWRNLGETYYELGNLAATAERKALYDKAADAFTKALQINRTDARTHYDLGLLYYRQANIEESYLKKGKYRLAALEFQNALPALENDPELHLNLGVIYDQLEQYAEAASSYARAAALAPGEPVPYFLGGIAERNGKRYDRAIALLEKAAELDPDNQDTLYALAIVFQDMNEEEKAETYFARAARANAKGFTEGVTSVVR